MNSQFIPALTLHTWTKVFWQTRMFIYNMKNYTSYIISDKWGNLIICICISEKGGKAEKLISTGKKTITLQFIAICCEHYYCRCYFLDITRTCLTNNILSAFLPFLSLEFIWAQWDCHIHNFNVNKLNITFYRHAACSHWACAQLNVCCGNL